MIRRSTVLFSTAAAVSALALSAAPATAVTTSTFTAVTTGASPQVAFADTTNGVAVTCASSTAAGTINLGPIPASGRIGTIATSTFTRCDGPLGLTMKITQTAPWVVTGAGLGSPTGRNPVTIKGVAATVTALQGGCSFTVSGTVKGSLNIVGQSLSLVVKPTTSTMTISAVSGCFGQVGVGDKASMRASYRITATA
jgi:hypothetical protein